MYNILSYIEDAKIKYADKIAFADTESEVTFAQLEHGAKAVGSFLSKIVQPKNPIVFYGEKSAELLKGFFGAVYAGCFYVLVDPKHPTARIKAILDKLDAKIIVTQQEDITKIYDLDFKGDIFNLKDIIGASIDEYALNDIRSKTIDTDILYAIFTSGSTGQPKGVAVSHRSVIDFTDIFTDTFKITSEDVIANQAPFDFDVSVKDIYSGIKTGATVQIIPRAYFSFPTRLMDFLCERHVTTLIWAVSALCFVTTMNALEYKTPKDINKVMFSGEVMPIKHLNKLRKFLPRATYVNLYGPTEITCNCMYYIIDKEFLDSQVLPLGTAFKNERVFLLDENNKLVTQKHTLGEICVAGTALALGYYGDREKTNESFIQNPINSLYNEMIYKTGDLAKYDDEGMLVYSTRKDFQIKHMGHRIELGEIETAINAVENVERSCCIYLQEKQKIVAFYHGDIDKKQITIEIKKTLPIFMLPTSYVQVLEMPMTKNGKINRDALKEML